jgi:WhiB family transcriptional regulator, redox-sensing transcriptional regulator
MTAPNPRPGRLPLAWAAKGLCAPRDGASADEIQAILALFFSDRSTLDGMVAEADAKRVCRKCPVRLQCLEYALEAGEHSGVWGGLNEVERLPIWRWRKQRRSA